ncbi:MAG: hypothetical protein QXX59_07155 [Candidatus Bathyarchaeia archaeon]
MVHLDIDEIAEGILRVLKPESFQVCGPPTQESEEELIERQDSKIVAKPEVLEGQVVKEVTTDDLLADRRFPAVGIDEGLWRWVLGTHDILVCISGHVNTWLNFPQWSKEVTRDWAVVVRSREVLNSQLPYSLRSRVYLLSSHHPIEGQVDRLASHFMQTQLRSTINSAMNLPGIKIDEIDGALRAYSHQHIDKLGNTYRYVYEKTGRMVSFIVKRPRMQTIVRHFGLDQYSDDRAFYLSKMIQGRKSSDNYMRSHWIRECDPRVTKENQVTFCWILTPRNLIFRIETFYWMFKEKGDDILNLVISDSYQNGGGFLPLHQTLAHEQFSISEGLRQMFRAKLAQKMKIVSPESTPWEAYGWGD